MAITDNTPRSGLLLRASGYAEATGLREEMRMAITDWPEFERPRDNKPQSGLLRRRLTFRLCRSQKLPNENQA